MEERLEAFFDQRIKRDDLRATFPGLLQLREHAGMVGTRILAHNQDQVRLIEILEDDGSLADPDGFAHGDPAGFVAHV